MKWLGALLDRICAALGALIFIQIPLFMQQYMQQLLGREAELKLQIESMRQSAVLSGKTLEQYIQKFVASSDPDFMRQGELMHSMMDRWHSYSEALSAYQGSSVVGRPFAFLMHLNGDVFKSTLDHYTFGLPLTIEAGVYALLGVVMGYLAFSLVRNLYRRLIGFAPHRTVNS